ncbi:MAG TPA: amino acid permease [Anaerolineae bacterium]
MINHGASSKTAEPVTLVRDLTLFSSTMIGVGAMIGAGIFVLTGIGAGLAGPALMLAFILNGIATIFTAMVYAELGSSFPDAGGGYLWVKEALPQPAGFLSGWMSWYAHFVACSLYALGFGSFFTEFLTSLGFDFWGADIAIVSKVVTVSVVVIFTAINYRGASETGLAGNIVTMVKVAVLLVFIGFGMAATFRNPDWWQNFQPFAPNGMIGIFVAMGVTFIGFEGYEIIAQSSEEIIDPKRSIPKAVFFSLLIVVPIYVLIAFVAIGGLSGLDVPVWEFLGSQRELAMAEAARRFIPGGAFVLLFAGLMSTASALNATIYSSSRVSFAMGRDHNLPDLFSHISRRTNTPSYAILISSAFIVIGALTLPIEDVAAGTVVMFKLLFLLVNVSVINLRRNRPDLDRGYIIPWFPGVPLIGIVLKLLLAIFLYELSPIAWYSAIAWIMVGVVFYYLYSRPREMERTETPLVQEVREPHGRRHNILISIANERHIEPLAHLAKRIATQKESAVWGLHAVKVPDILPIGSAREIALRRQELLEKVAAKMDAEVPFSWMLRATHSVGRAIQDSIRAKDIDLLIMGWPRPSQPASPASPLGKTLRWVLERLLCDVLVVRLREPAERLDFSSIVVPVRGGAQSRFAIEIARLLADEMSRLHFVHVAPQEQVVNREKLARILDLEPEEITVVTVQQPDAQIPRDKIAAAILKYAAKEEASALVVGASEEGIVYRKVYGDIPVELASQFHGNFILAKRYSGRVKSYLQEFFGSRPTESLSDVEEVIAQE